MGVGGALGVGVICGADVGVGTDAGIDVGSGPPQAASTSAVAEARMRSATRTIRMR